jgi:flagellar motor switch protein FliN/FliY
MSESTTRTKVFDCFCSAFVQVLSQCSGAQWSASAIDADLSQSSLQIKAMASGSLTGEFAFVLTPDTGILLAQVLMMSEQPAETYGEEEKEAAVELLRQVCGLCATSLGSDIGQLTLSVSGEASLNWAPAEQRTIQLAQSGRAINITLALGPELVASASPHPIDSQTDRPNLEGALAAKNLDLLMNVRLGVRLRFGSRKMKLREVLDFHAGTIVELDRQVQEPVDLLVDSKLIARGEVVIVDGNYGLKVTDVLSPKQCVEALY